MVFAFVKRLDGVRETGIGILSGLAGRRGWERFLFVVRLFFGIRFLLDRFWYLGFGVCLVLRRR